MLSSDDGRERGEAVECARLAMARFNLVDYLAARAKATRKVSEAKPGPASGDYVITMDFA